MRRLSYSDRDPGPPRLLLLLRAIASGECRVKLQPPVRRLAVAFAVALSRVSPRLTVLAAEPLARLLDGPGVRVAACGEQAGGPPYAVLWCDEVPQGTVFCAGEACLRVRWLRPLRCRELEGGVYEVSGCGVRGYVKLAGGSLEEAGPPVPPELLRALDALRRAVAEYGSLSIKDAVTVVASELGVARGDARRLLYEAARRGLVRVVEGYVTDVKLQP